jgi:hypothetical protein
MAEFSGALCIANDSETTDVTDHVDDTSQENVAYPDARWKRVAVKHERLHQALAEVVDDYGLLNYVTLDITSAESVGRLLAKIDKRNVYVFHSIRRCGPIRSDGRHSRENRIAGSIHSVGPKWHCPNTRASPPTAGGQWVVMETRWTPASARS